MDDNEWSGVQKINEKKNKVCVFDGELEKNDNNLVQLMISFFIYIINLAILIRNENETYESNNWPRS